MPRILKVVYLGAAALAVIALIWGSYDVVVAGRESASLGSDVLLPLAVLVVIVALYLRRKRGMERRRQ